MLPIQLSIHKIPRKSPKLFCSIFFVVLLCFIFVFCTYKMLNWNALFCVHTVSIPIFGLLLLFLFVLLLFRYKVYTIHVELQRENIDICLCSASWSAFMLNNNNKTVAHSSILCSAIYRTRHSSFSITCLCRRRCIVAFITLYCNDHVLYAFIFVSSLSRRTLFSPFLFFSFQFHYRSIRVYVCVCEWVFFPNSLFERIVWLRMLYLNAVVKTLMENRSHIIHNSSSEYK